MNKDSQRLDFVFFGTPDVAAETLEILKSHGYVPKLIVTNPDKPVGRHFTLTPTPVKMWATSNNVNCVHSLDSLPPADLFIVVAYGKILSQEIIDSPKLGTLNIHYSLLPRWRGASPIEAALLHGDNETGVSIQKMVFKLDAGPIIASKKIPIEPTDQATTLKQKLIPLGAELLVEVLTNNNFEGEPQDESLVTHKGKIKKEDALVNPFTDNPVELWNKYRAYFEWPGIYFFDTNNKRVKITQAQLEDGKFIIEKVIPEGKKETNWQHFCGNAQ